MRRIFIIVLAIVSLGFSVLPAVTASAADAPTVDISDDQVAQIRQNCKPAQSVLQRLQTTDVVTRINRGRIYDNLINGLMNPFNSRVSLNRYDASALTAVTGQISQKFATFTSDYISYQNSFTKLLAINCQSDPRGFYDLLVETREGRTDVSGDIADLNSLIDQYTSDFTALQKSVEGQ